MARTGNQGSNDPEVTYFKEFVRLLEEQYAWASVEAVSEEIDFARMAGPALAGLKQRPDGVFILRTPIGRGDYAYVELEYDQSGVLTPVMGGIIKG